MVSLQFRLISERYEHGRIILTSNEYFCDWEGLLSDNILAAALLNRLSFRRTEFRRK